MLLFYKRNKYVFYYFQSRSSEPNPCLKIMEQALTKVNESYDWFNVRDDLVDWCTWLNVLYSWETLWRQQHLYCVMYDKWLYCKTGRHDSHACAVLTLLALFRNLLHIYFNIWIVNFKASLTLPTYNVLLKKL